MEGKKNVAECCICGRSIRENSDYFKVSTTWMYTCSNIASDTLCKNCYYKVRQYMYEQKERIYEERRLVQTQNVGLY